MNPEHPPAIPMELEPEPLPEKPTVLTVVAVLNLVFGVMGLCGSVGSVVPYIEPFRNLMSPDNPAIDVVYEHPWLRAYMFIGAVVGVAVTGLLIAGGIGLLNNRLWGRTLSLAYAWLTIALGVLGTVINIAVVLPLMMEKAKEVDAAVAGGMIGGAIGGAIAGCMGVAYPVVVLVFLWKGASLNYLRAMEAGRAALGRARE